MINHYLIQKALRAKLLTLSVCTTGSTAIAATSTGYTRAAGSFITDGFKPGMEVTGTGFGVSANNAAKTILSVTAGGLTCSGCSVEAEGTRTLAVVAPAGRAWENVEYTPTTGKPYIKEEFTPGPMAKATLGPLGILEVDPLYIVKVFVPADKGVGAVRGYIDALTTLFAPGTSLSVAGHTVKVRGNPAPFSGQLLPAEPGFVFVPFTVPLRVTHGQLYLGERTMTYQTAGNVLVAIKAKTTTGVAVGTVTGATQLRIIDSPGLKLTRAVVQSEKKRADGNKTMGRLGYKGVDGSFSAEISPGGATDILAEAVMRGAWVTANAIGFATMTTVTVGTNEIVANAGDWVGDQGIRVGDVFYMSNQGADSDKNLRVTAVTSLTINVPAGSLTADASAATTGTLTVLRRLITATTPSRKSFNVEQYDKDTDLSELFLGCRCTGFSLSCQPGAMATVQYSFIGMDRTALAVGTSPFFTNPSLTTDLGMIADDSSIQKDGVAIADFTGFDLNFTLAAGGEPVIGSLTTPDIFDNDMTVTGTITGLREDFTYVDAYDAETEFELSILLETSETAPVSCFGIYLPRVKVQALSAPFGGGDGAKVETRELMVGVNPASTGYDATIAAFHTSEVAS